MANGDPILVFGDESDTWIGDFSFAHLVGAVVYVDPPFATVRAAQVPLVTSVHTFCLGRLKTAAHRVEHLLRRRILMLAAAAVAAPRQIAQQSQPIGKNKRRFPVKLLGISIPLHLSFVLRHSPGLIAQFASEEKRRREM